MKHASFIAKTALLGIVAALLLLWLIPQPNPSTPTDTTPVINNDTAESNDAAIVTPLNLGTGPVSYASAVERAAPAVVNIYTAKKVAVSQSPFDTLLYARPRYRVETGLGSGVIINAQGYIATNYHVIKGADDIRVSLRDGRDFAAALVGADIETDLAILKIDATNLQAIAIGNSDVLHVGDVVLAIGNPLGIGQTVTMGIISATGRQQLGLSTFENFLQTDAAINPGNSGGALVNTHGELVGINSAIVSQSGGYEGIGFAIPSNMAGEIFKELFHHGKVIRGWLGVGAHDLPKAVKQKVPDGVWVTDIYPNGPADKAGLQIGDIITHIDNDPINNSHAMLTRITQHKPGDKMKIRLWRNQIQRSINTTAVLMQRPAVR
ncbi:MAG: trypsin-like peptidase domain-containing protein [Gammaproteobacteria bacterium]|nr:trypsin-like peptidase domain-containing protein [Gammaproteobacteria bacterium]